MCDSGVSDEGPSVAEPDLPTHGRRDSDISLQTATAARTVAAGSLAALWRMMKSDELNRLIGVDEIRQKESALYGSLRDR